MVTRTIRRTVTFTKPFTLQGFDHAQPAGAYTVETDEEALDTMTFTALRRIATRIELHPRAGSSTFMEVVTIDPAELEVALANDAAIEPAPTGEKAPLAGVAAKCP
jgi:hypothetical protein